MSLSLSPSFFYFSFWALKRVANNWKQAPQFLRSSDQAIDTVYFDFVMINEIEKKSKEGKIGTTECSKKFIEQK